MVSTSSWSRERRTRWVGESGCGKSATGFAVLRLVEPGRISGGKILFEGQDLLALRERDLRRVRGGRIGLVFQEAGAALNPVMKVGKQIAEVVRLHAGVSRAEAKQEAIAWLERVALRPGAQVYDAFAHQLSGGMQQRVMLAIALAGRPSLLIADEPTTALDVTIQAEILALLGRLKAELDLTVLFVTHDLAVVAETADRIGVMYAGQLVEEGRVRDVLDAPAHPYTRGLIAALPQQAPPGTRRLPTLQGQVPAPGQRPSGCRFHPRCADVFEPCSTEIPQVHDTGDARWARCHLHRETQDASTDSVTRPASPGRPDASA